VRRAARHDQQVADLEGQGPVLGLEDAGPRVHEVRDVTVGVPQEPVRRPWRPGPPSDRDFFVLEKTDGQRVDLAFVIAAKVHGDRPKWAIDRDPAGRCVQPREMRRRASESLPSVLLLHRARRHVDVRLARRASAYPLRPDERVVAHDVPLTQQP
jgi:hypothetical protein